MALAWKPALQGKRPDRSYPLAFGYLRLYNNTEIDALIDRSSKIWGPEVGRKMSLVDLENDLKKSRTQWSGTRMVGDRYGSWGDRIVLEGARRSSADT